MSRVAWALGGVLLVAALVAVGVWQHVEEARHAALVDARFRAEERERELTQDGYRCESRLASDRRTLHDLQEELLPHARDLVTDTEATLAIGGSAYDAAEARARLRELEGRASALALAIDASEHECALIAARIESIQQERYALRAQLGPTE